MPKTEIEKLEIAALASNNTEQFILIGERYEYGIGIEPSIKNAVKWYKKAAQKGNPEGAYCLGCLYEDEYRSKKFRALALRHFIEAAQAGHTNAQLTLGDTYYFGYLSEVSISSAIYWYEKAAETGEVSAWLELAIIYLDPSHSYYSEKRGDHFVKKILQKKEAQYIALLAYKYLPDPPYEYLPRRSLPLSLKKAVKYFKIASDLDWPNSTIMLARLYCGMSGYKKNKTLANKYLAKVYGYYKAAYPILNVAIKLENGWELTYSGEKPFRWYKRAADLGNKQAQKKVGRFYRDGKGCRKNLALAEKWLKKSADQGSGSAMFSLAHLYKEQWDRQDYKKSMFYFKKALKKGVKNSYAEIGWLYQDGQGVNKSSKRAFRWFKNGVDNGDRRSQYGIGCMYLNGWGCEQDYSLALKHFKIALEAGFSRANTNLGYMYKNGLGCKKNRKRAVEYYLAGMEANEALSYNNLAVMYDYGEYFKEDKQKALELYNKAIELGCSHTKFYLGLKYISGTDVKKNTLKAMKYFEESILDEKQADNFKAIQYQQFAEKHFEESNSLDAAQAEYWFQKAAEKGSKRAYIFLGHLYETGNMVEKNWNKALSFYRKAIRQGDYEPCEYLAKAFMNGKGVKKNHPRAIELFSQAFSEGFLIRYNNDFAWLLSTTPHYSLVDGVLAQKLVKVDIRKQGVRAFRLDTLAAAYAASGKYRDAVKTQERAIRRLKKEKKLEQLDEFEERLDCYQSGRRWVQR